VDWLDRVGGDWVGDAMITAIHSGGDWHDASTYYVVLNDGVSIQAERDAWRKWYEEVYLEAFRRGERMEYMNLAEWCLERGARNPTKGELEIFCDE
jgi:hypothetical protein